MKKIFTGMLIASFFLSQAQVKVTALPAASTPSGTEVLPMVQDGITKKVTVNQLRTLTGTANRIPYFNGSGTLTNDALFTRETDSTAINTVKFYAHSIGALDTAFFLIKVGNGGYNALVVDSSLNNTALGMGALQNNTTGVGNTAIGLAALMSNEDGQVNTAVGALALQSNTSGQVNTAVGLSALSANTIGHHNVAIGTSVLENITEGVHNLGLGTNIQGAYDTTSYSITIGCDATPKYRSIGIGHDIAIGVEKTLEIADYIDSLKIPLAFGSAGDVLTLGASGYANWLPSRIQATGQTSQALVAATTITVTFGGTQPDTNYQTTVTPTNVLSAALFYVTNKTTTTFDVVYLAGITGTVTFDWNLTR